MARYLVGEIDSISAATETFIKERPISQDVSGIVGARQTESKKGKVDVDDAAIFLARFKDGALGTFEATRFAPGCKNRHTFELYGSKGSLRWDLERMNILEYYNNEAPDHLKGFEQILATEPSHPYYAAWWPPGHNIGYEHLFVHEMFNFFQAIAGKTKKASPDFDDGVACQAVLATVEKAAKSKKWEKVLR
jgi:predicted dehydrogenase